MLNCWKFTNSMNCLPETTCFTTECENNLMLFVKTPGSVKFSSFHILICTNKIQICTKNWRLHTKINATIYYSIILMLLVIIKNLGNSWSLSLFLFYFLCSCNSFLYLLLDPVLVTSSHIWEPLHRWSTIEKHIHNPFGATRALQLCASMLA